MIKRGHRPLKNALLKLENNQVKNLIVVLFANNTIVYRPIRYTPFYIIYRQEPVLPIELKVLI